MFLFRFEMTTIEQSKRAINFNRLFDPPSTRKSIFDADSSPFYHITFLIPKTVIAHMRAYKNALTLGMLISGSGVYSFETHFDSFQLTFAKHRALPTDSDWLQRKSVGGFVTNNFALFSGDSDNFEYAVCTFFCPKSLLTLEAP